MIEKSINLSKKAGYLKYGHCSRALKGEFTRRTTGTGEVQRLCMQIPGNGVDTWLSRTH